MHKDSINATLELCKDLIRRPSITPMDEGCQELIRDRLENIGFECVCLPFGDVTNLWSIRGKSGPKLVFAGHTDVVPAGPTHEWKFSPFEPTERDGFLYGRGAADMKGSLAAMVVACERFVGKHPDHLGQIGFLLTSDEEGPAINGTKKVMDFLKSRNIKIDWCVIGEPSSQTDLGDTLKNGRRGSLNGKLMVEGIQGHIAYPQFAKNPIHLIVPVLKALIDEEWDVGNNYFPPTQLQISNIFSGEGATNVIPSSASALLNIRFSNEITDLELRNRIEKLVSKFDVTFKIDWQLSGKPFLTEKHELVRAAIQGVEKITGIRPKLSTGGGTSDGRFIAAHGTEVIEIGPVNASIHQIDEHVKIEDLKKLSDIYFEIMSDLLLE